ncbi:hypothetical protein [Paraherbaspirillum soli]|uniref:Uncharacterized protein n=1 Tax=Paraherbaspirillum soli TaxID=631222 RepID=A0ABW0M7L5_9BURK
MMRLILFFLMAFLSVVGHAAENNDLSACQADLKNLIVPNFKTVMNKNDISLDLAENDNGVYKVRLFVGADNPNKQVSIGWVVLDTNKYTAYDITRDDEHPDKLNVDASKYKSFVGKCLNDKNSSKKIVNTSLPFVFDKYYRCATGEGKTDDCNRYHAYPSNTIEHDIRSQIDSSIDTVFLLPSIFDFRIFLAGRAETDVNVYYLYVFRGNKLISKELVGKMDGVSIITFDISKDYLVTTYERKGTILSKIKNVAHLKLDGSGKFITCPNSNPTCK